MILSYSVIQTLRVKVSAAAIGAIILTASHAAARNHDLQIIKFPSVPPALHDRALGPFQHN